MRSRDSFIRILEVSRFCFSMLFFIDLLSEKVMLVMVGRFFIWIRRVLLLRRTRIFLKLSVVNRARMVLLIFLLLIVSFVRIGILRRVVLTAIRWRFSKWIFFITNFLVSYTVALLNSSDVMSNFFIVIVIMRFF